MRHHLTAFVDRLRKRARSARRGQVLVIVGVGLTVFIAITGLVVDYGVWLTDQRSMRNAADAAAQAGVSELSLPVTGTKRTAASQHAMQYLNEQLRLGLSSGEIAPAAAAAMSADGFGSEDGTSYAGPDRFSIRTPVTAADSCTNRDWGNRSVTVRIDHQSPRFFSAIFFGGTQSVDVCATSVVDGRGYAIAVLKPNANAGTPPGPNYTMSFGGSGSWVEVCGGDVGINSLFKGGASPGPGDPAYVKFMNGNSADPCLIDNQNRMELTLDTPSPPAWNVAPPQIRIEGATSATNDDLYQAPRHLPSYIKIPTWGAANFAALIAADATTPAITMRDTDPGNGTCTPPVVSPPYADAIAPGKYNLLQVGVDEKRWLCPGVYHLVKKPGTDGLDLQSDAIIAGQGVTLVFDDDATMDIRGGAAILLNSTAAGGTVTPADWTTGDPRHPVPITIYIEPKPCGPVPSLSCASSSVSNMQAHAGIDIKGVIFGPTEELKIAGNGLHNGAGEIWAWTLTYVGQSTLRQDYEGNDPGYPLIVE